MIPTPLPTIDFSHKSSCTSFLLRYLLLRISVTASEELKHGKSELAKLASVLENVDAVANVFGDSLKQIGSLKQIAEDVKTLRYFLNNLAGVAAG